MKISEAWLRSLVDLDGIPRQQLLDGLTAAGLEVEAAEPVAPRLEGVVVARIESAEPHPNAGKLQVCRVDTGDGTLRQIVCGAPNARVGLVAPLATLGTVMPGGLEIKAAQLRGVDSEGMLCSAAELGLDADASGLLELPSDLRPGLALADALALDDVSIELKLTPNRSDCLGARGLARELSTIFARPLRESAPQSITLSANERLAIRLEAGAACPRYLGRAMVGLDVNAVTPLWMRERLRRSGLRCIHPLVDITNYVLLETGQPMHAFDLDTLEGGIHVRHGRPAETIELLDGRTVAVGPEFVVVADDRGAVALGGVMGGARTRVSSTTSRVFFEAAHFAPAAIMGRARKLGLVTDAAHRFERGVDPHAPGVALELATHLTLAILGGAAGQVCAAERSGDLPRAAVVELRQARLDRVLGIPVAPSQVETLLTRLGCKLAEVAGGWSVQVPGARFDLAIEEDLIEEVARLVGYDHIPAISPVGSLVARSLDETHQPIADLRRRLMARDFHEAVTLAFTASSAQRAFVEEGARLAVLANPLSADLDTMRASLLPGLVAALGHNQRRQQARVRLFETGRVFLDGGQIEAERLAAVVCGNADAAQWGRAARPVDFHDLAGVLQVLVGSRRTLALTPAQFPWSHPGRSAHILLDGQLAGQIGQVHPQLAGRLDLHGECYAFEVALQRVAEWPLPRAVEISRFPSTRRDLALVLPTQVEFAQVERALREAAGTPLQVVELFDVYRGTGLPEGSRSLAIGLIFQEHSRTLTDAEVDRLITLCVDRIGTALGGSLRR